MVGICNLGAVHDSVETLDRRAIIAKLQENEAELRAQGVGHAVLFGSPPREPRVVADRRLLKPPVRSTGERKSCVLASKARLAHSRKARLAHSLHCVSANGRNREGFRTPAPSGGSCGLWGGRPKALEGGNRGKEGGWFGGLDLWGFEGLGWSAGGRSEWRMRWKPLGQHMQKKSRRMNSAASSVMVLSLSRPLMR